MDIFVKNNQFWLGDDGTSRLTMKCHRTTKSCVRVPYHISNTCVTFFWRSGEFIWPSQSGISTPGRAKYPENSGNARYRRMLFERTKEVRKTLFRGLWMTFSKRGASKTFSTTFSAEFSIEPHSDHSIRGVGSTLATHDSSWVPPYPLELGILATSALLEK